jgi:hypothetical protein
VGNWSAVSPGIRFQAVKTPSAFRGIFGRGVVGIAVGLTALLLLCSCEIVYDDTPDSSEKVPEFRLKSAKVSRYEDYALTAELSAESVEQYKKNTAIYGEKVGFRMYEDGAEIGHGTCGLILADNDKDNYVLFDGIDFDNTRDSFAIKAESMRWSSKQGILSSGKDTKVTITKTRTQGEGDGDNSTFTLWGTEFSASGNLRSFDFDGPVEGVFITADPGAGES